MMKKLTNGLFLLIVVGLVGTSCKKYTTPEPLNLQKPNTYSEAYYDSLRAYKNSNHARCFVWLSDYGVVPTTSSMGERFSGLPDSVDIISIWGGFPSPEKNPLDYKEMRFVQEKKGTKLLSVVIVDIGKYPKNDQGIAQYIADLKKDVYNNRLDGLDLDYEPSDGFFTQPANFVKLVAGLSQFLGPRSGTGKILDIDYYNLLPPAELADYVDFVVQQNYGANSDIWLDAAYTAISSYITPEKYFVTENIGDYWQTGGVTYRDRNNKTMNSLLGFAKWNPAAGRKGGFGAFMIQRDYYNPEPYAYLRTAIQACNPAKR